VNVRSVGLTWVGTATSGQKRQTRGPVLTCDVDVRHHVVGQGEGAITVHCAHAVVGGEEPRTGGFFLVD
jgi:hypothetical protein